jgi:hypothetical protein
MPIATLADLGSKQGLSPADQAWYDALKFGTGEPPKVETHPWGTVTHPVPGMMYTAARIPYYLRNVKTGETAQYTAPSGGYTVTPAPGWEIVPTTYGPPSAGPPLPAMQQAPPASEPRVAIPWWGWALGVVGVLAIWRPWK